MYREMFRYEATTRLEKATKLPGWVFGQEFNVSAEVQKGDGPIPINL